MASMRSVLKPWLLMIIFLLVGFLMFVTASEDPPDSTNDFAEFETEGDEDEEETQTTTEEGSSLYNITISLAFSVVLSHLFMAYFLKILKYFANNLDLK